MPRSTIAVGWGLWGLWGVWGVGSGWALGEDSPRCETVLSFAVSEQQECLLSGRPP